MSSVRVPTVTAFLAARLVGKRGEALRPGTTREQTFRGVYRMTRHRPDLQIGNSVKRPAVTPRERLRPYWNSTTIVRVVGLARQLAHREPQGGGQLQHRRKPRVRPDPLLQGLDDRDRQAGPAGQFGLGEVFLLPEPGETLPED